MIEFIAVIILIVVWWCGLFAVFSGLGLLGRRAFGLSVQSAEAWILSFWTGWAFATLILQLWHLWLKIDVWALAIILALGIGGLLWNRSDVWQMTRACLSQNAVLASIVLLVAIWLADRAVGPIHNGDTGLYHMAAVKWAASYPIVPGLGNLHERLAFNSAFFLYAAMLGVGPWDQKSHYLANGLLLFVLLAQLLLSLHKIILRRPKYRSYHTFNVFLLAPTFGQMLHPWFPSLSPDFVIFILGVIVTSRAYYFFINNSDNIHEEGYNVFLISILCTAGVTMKHSFIPLGATIFIVVLLAWFFRCSKQDKKGIMKTLLWILLLNTSLLSIWMLRGVILSGYPIFPYTLGGLPVPWRVPRPLALSVTHWIHSWARAPGISWTDVLDNWNWLRPWLKNFPYEYTKALITGMLAMILYVITIPRIVQNSPGRNHGYLIILGASFISSIFWFFSAPDPRFSGACFWIFGPGFAAMAIDNMGWKSSKITTAFEYFLILSFFIYLFPSYRPLLILPNQEDGPFYHSPAPEYFTVSINNLDRLNLPKKNDQCWDIPIPCTPYPRSNLRLRGKSLDSGFMLDETVTFADMHQGSIPRGVTVSQGIGVALMSGFWPDLDDGPNVRWMRAPGTILVYTEHDTYVKLSLKPFAMNTQGDPGIEWHLKVSLNKSSNAELPLKSGMTTEAVLELRPDFNIITLDLAAVNEKSSAPYAGNANGRPVGVAFSSIELNPIALLR